MFLSLFCGILIGRYLISNKDAVLDKEGEVPAATLMAQFIRLTGRIASQDKPTAITIGCQDSTVTELETIKRMLGGFLNIIKRLNINQILSEFLSAIRATAVSV